MLFADEELEVENDDSDDGFAKDGEPGNCDGLPFVRRPSSLPTTAFDFFGCSAENEGYLTQMFQNVIDVSQLVGSTQTELSFS
jgi:hypothetical protein